MEKMADNTTEKHPAHQPTWGKTSEGMGCRKLPEMQQDNKMRRSYKPQKNSKVTQRDI